MFFRNALSLLALMALATAALHAAEAPHLVKDGDPKAEIVIAKASPRSTRLAAQELQSYVEKISGAKLTIVNAPSEDATAKVYVGRSSYTDRLGISTKDLKYGAYRIVSGENWLVLIGQDTDFTPTEPWPRHYGTIRNGDLQKAWNAITNAEWGVPMLLLQIHKHYSGRNALFGTTEEEKVDKEGNVNVWTYDERGSFNAVCGFLRDLGVRWYMPGEIGEIVPRMKSIPVPGIDKTVHPDFSLRKLNFRAGIYTREANLWGFRLGVRQPYGTRAVHGLEVMTRPKTIRDAHPEWFALYGGKRNTQPGRRLHQLCYSNEELLAAAVRFARAQFVHYDLEVVSIMPPDGYTAMCQCKLCEGKGSPQLGERGQLSNYVWGFVNRVAREVRKTHPHKRISCSAYGVYSEPPSNIDKLEPNVQVSITGGRGPFRADREDRLRLRKAWEAKTDNPIEIGENYPFTKRGFYLPAYIPRILGEGINETKGVTRGEDIWLSMDFSEKAIGFNHFLIYFTARLYWGGKNADAIAMFEEYVRLFYGPAASEMRAFFDYCEEHWRGMEKEVEKADRALTLFAAAKAKAPAGSVYAKRIKLIDNYLSGLRSKREQLQQKRGPVPRLRFRPIRGGSVVIDGKLDEAVWQNCPTSSRGWLAESQTGRRPIYGTSFKTAWIGNNLYFGIRCQDHPGGKLNITATRDDDPAIWYGDLVEILLDTDMHSHYQIVVNPKGTLVDLDRGVNKENWFGWSSLAEVATQVADDHWTVEIRIPVTQDENDPLHGVIGRQPTQSLPWHLNICRLRQRENGLESSAFSPTGVANFHKRMKFAHFYHGLSHRFDVDPTVTDYIIAARKARDLALSGKREDALAAYVALAAGDELTDFQKSDALQHAAAQARHLRDFARANELAEQIPITAVAKTVRMENLLRERRRDALIEQFGNEDLSRWPFWQIGAGAFVRGEAYAAKKMGTKAEEDFRNALAYTSDTILRSNICAAMGDNYERNLKDDDKALAAYRESFGSQKPGNAATLRSIDRAARILTRKGEIDEAFATIGRVDIDKLTGTWKPILLLSLGNTQAAAGKTDEALATFQKVLANKKARDAHHRAARKAIEKLTGNAP